uniref:non-specific serine/threonine protein kinase n=2 Tax=Caenorhabditis tropicalis TaxID=1561998 RepID=A0A1I7TDG0_9PELO
MIKFMNLTVIPSTASHLSYLIQLGEWYLIEQIGEGTFANVFVGRNDGFDKSYAIKVESRLSKMDFILNEITIMRCLTYPNELPHFPKPIAFEKEKNIGYIAMTLLGESLRNLKLKCHNRRFLRGTWSRIGIQALYAVKLFHEKGFIHRDIKPENLVMGAEDDEKRWRIVHLIDFGLARQWAWLTDKDSKKYEARPLRKNAPFRGTVNFVSPNAHLNQELGRRDDLWSLLFTLVDLNGRVPWFSERDHVKLLEAKTNSTKILEKMPRSFERLINHLKGLSALQRPNYHMFFNILREILTESGQTPSSKYTFEETELTEEEMKERKAADWEDEKGTFFARDSVKINSPKDCFKKEKEDWMVPKLDDFEALSKIDKAHPNDKYLIRFNNNIVRRTDLRIVMKELDIDVQEYETDNELLNEDLPNERKKLNVAQENPVKNIPKGERTEENKGDEVNMTEVVLNKEEKMRRLQLDIIRKAREKKANKEKEKKSGQ